MAAKSLTPQERGAYIVAASQKYHVPWQILWGVYGVETAHGTNVTTSSAGAKGGFQFIKETAEAYKYPYTNEQTAPIFAAQSDAAARYLATLYHQKGSWDGALKAYSGGGYGYPQVKAASKTEAQQLPGGSKSLGSEIPLVGGAVEGAESAVSGVEGAASAASEALAVLVDPNTWLRVAEGVGGIVMLAMGLKTLTRGNPGGPLGELGRQAGEAKHVAKRGAELVGVAAVL